MQLKKILLLMLVIVLISVQVDSTSVSRVVSNVDTSKSIDGKYTDVRVNGKFIANTDYFWGNPKESAKQFCLANGHPGVISWKDDLDCSTSQRVFYHTRIQDWDAAGQNKCLSEVVCGGCFETKWVKGRDCDRHCGEIDMVPAKNEKNQECISGKLIIQDVIDGFIELKYQTASKLKSQILSFGCDPDDCSSRHDGDTSIFTQSILNGYKLNYCYTEGQTREYSGPNTAVACYCKSKLNDCSSLPIKSQTSDLGIACYGTSTGENGCGRSTRELDARTDSLAQNNAEGICKSEGYEYLVDYKVDIHDTNCESTYGLTNWNGQNFVWTEKNEVCNKPITVISEVTCSKSNTASTLSSDLSNGKFTDIRINGNLISNKGSADDSAKQFCKEQGYEKVSSWKASLSCKKAKQVLYSAQSSQWTDTWGTNCMNEITCESSLSTSLSLSELSSSTNTITYTDTKIDVSQINLLTTNYVGDEYIAYYDNEAENVQKSADIFCELKGDVRAISYKSDLDCQPYNGIMYHKAHNGWIRVISPKCVNEITCETTRSVSSSVSSVCQDKDKDGYQDSSCGGKDCDDTNPDVYPDAPEICDNIDNQCGGVGFGEIDESCDVDGDGYCNSLNTYKGAVKVCTKGYNDCDDRKYLGANTYPGATEVCDGKDNDCGGNVDEGCTAESQGYCFYKADNLNQNVPVAYSYYNGEKFVEVLAENSCIENEVGQLATRGMCVQGNYYSTNIKCDNKCVEGTCLDKVSINFPKGKYYLLGANSDISFTKFSQCGDYKVLVFDSGWNQYQPSKDNSRYLSKFGEKIPQGKGFWFFPKETCDVRLDTTTDYQIQDLPSGTHLISAGALLSEDYSTFSNNVCSDETNYMWVYDAFSIHSTQKTPENERSIAWKNINRLSNLDKTIKLSSLETNSILGAWVYCR